MPINKLQKITRIDEASPAIFTARSFRSSGILWSGLIIRIFAFLSFCAITLNSGAQVVVERSKNKIVIDGESYFIHIVKKGETYYSISRAYGITTGQLEKENPAAGASLKEGQSLRIPVKIVSGALPSQPQVPEFETHDDSRFIYHKLSQGETIYSLSKKYNVSEQEILDSNPGIDITKLPLGSEIAVPRKNDKQMQPQNVKVSPKEYYHKVESGETLSSIARQYGISIRELKRANGNLRFPHVGDYIRIPGIYQEEVSLPEPAAIDTLPVTQEPASEFRGRPSEITQLGTLSGSVNIAVLLPFYLNENAKRVEIDSSKTVKGKTDYRKLVRPEDWIYPASIEFVEMYEGILLAADTLRSLGLNINIHTYDIKSDTLELINLISSGALDNMDLIIGPVYNRNLSIMASYAGKLSIPVISPVPLFSNSVLENNPSLFMAGASLEVAQKNISRKVSEFPDNNFVLIHSGSDSQDYDTDKFKSILSSELCKKMPPELIKINDLVFYSRSEFGADSVIRLERILSDKTCNIIIIASEDAPVMSEAVMEVRNLSRKFDMKVFGYPEMQNLTNIDPKFFFDLGLMIYTPGWIDYSSPDVIAFNSDFRNKFLTEPSEDSYAWQGYDVAYFFISGIALHGREFISHPEIHNPDLLHTEFDFRRKNMNDGFENQKLYLIRYNNNLELENIRE